MIIGSTANFNSNSSSAGGASSGSSGSSSAAVSSSIGSAIGMGAAQKSMGKDDFIQLLVTQLKNQDPLDPMEGTDFSAQLAQFSSLEQMFNLNQTLTNMQQAQTDFQASQSVNLIGKQIQASGNQFNLGAVGSSAITFNLAGGADQVTITIKDANGKPVNTLKQVNLASGDQQVNWNGLDQSGARMPAGSYTYSVTATNPAGGTVPATTYTVGSVTGIVYDNTNYQLYAALGNIQVPMNSISKIN